MCNLVLFSIFKTGKSRYTKHMHIYFFHFTIVFNKIYILLGWAAENIRNENNIQNLGCCFHFSLKQYSNQAIKV